MHKESSLRMEVDLFYWDNLISFLPSWIEMIYTLQVLSPSLRQTKSCNSIPFFSCLIVSVLGCSDIKAPGNSWAERNGEEIRVGCRNSKESWTLKCQGNRWVGFLGNCSGQPGTLWSSSQRISFYISIWVTALFSPDIYLAFCLVSGPQVLAAEAPETGPSHSLSSGIYIIYSHSNKSFIWTLPRKFVHAYTEHCWPTIHICIISLRYWGCSDYLHQWFICRDLN